MAGLTEYPFPRFAGGLNLRDQPDVVNPAQAIDLLDVTFTERGAVRQRDGYGLFTSAVGANRYDSLTAFSKTDGTRQIVAGAGNGLEALSSSGSVIASVAATTGPHFFARFGGPSVEAVYAANGTDQIRQWNGSAWSTPAWSGTAPTGRFVAVTQGDNRLVNARRSGTTAGDNPSTVRFSDPSTPTTFGANNWVDLTPGDGEPIMGMVSWREYLFVFKQSKFFVFGQTTDSGTGTPEFNYRPVDTGVGLCSSRALCATPFGVFFLTQRGVYLTDGGEPKLVSELLDPFWLGNASDFYRSNLFNHSALSAPVMAWHKQQVYLAVPTGGSSTNDRLLVYDPRYEWWSLWSLPCSGLASFPADGRPELFFSLATGSNHIGRQSQSYSQDNESPIAARWRSGWLDLDDPNVKSLKESKVWGKGNVWVSFTKDYESSTRQKLVSFGRGADLWGDGTDPGDVWGDGT